MSKRVVITGLGILASNGKGRKDYWSALREGRVGYRPVTLFDTSEYRVHEAGEISDFDPVLYMGSKGLRTLDRSTKLLVSAAKLALGDCGFEVTPQNTDDVGVAVGSTMGSVRSIYEFDEVTLREGPRYTNPALFPNTVINSPASQVSIWCHIEGFNTTLSTGFTSSLDAMQYAFNFIQWDRAKLILTGGVEEMCLQTFLGFYSTRFMSGSKRGQPFLNCPFDRRRNGVTFSEGACLLAFEELEHARARGARILGEVLGFGYCFDTYRLYRYNPEGVGMRGAMTGALDAASLEAKDIDFIAADANSSKAADKVESYAIRQVFGQHARKVPVSAVKSMVGESFSVSGALNLSAALAALNEDFLPPTVNYKEKDPDCDLDCVPNTARPAKPEHILVNNFSPMGSNTAVVIKRYKE